MCFTGALSPEHLGRKAQPEVQRQQPELMAGGAIDLDEIATPEILDPRDRGAPMIAIDCSPGLCQLGSHFIYAALPRR
jgi:hypothetical protein